MSTTYVNTIDSLPLYADRAEKDAAGNTITTTYATKSEIPTVPVTDVEVDGSSVVNASGVAEITTPTVDQTYDGTSTNAQSGTAVAGALAGINEVPASSSTDSGKVLTVDSSGNPGWAAAQAPISAGNGIDITSNVISVDVDGGSLTNGANGLSVTLPVPATTGASQGDVLSVGQNGIEWATPSSGGGVFYATIRVTLFADILAAYNAGKSVYCIDPTYNIVYTLTGAESSFVTFGSSTAYDSNRVVRLHYIMLTSNDVWIVRDIDAVPALNGTQGMFLKSLGTSMAWTAINQVPASTSADEDKVLTVNSSGIAEWATPSGGGSVTDVEVDGTSVVNASGVAEITMPTVPALKALTAGNNITITEGANSVTIAATVADVPAVTSSDDGKVLKATYSGGSGSYAWGADTDTTYTAGNMIAIDPNNSNAIGVSTTAGITDIQQVNALPANPVSTVLYLIPET